MSNTGRSGIGSSIGMAVAGKTRLRLEGVARWLIVFVVVVAPWLFGAAEPWAYHSLSIVICCAAICCLVAKIINPQPQLAAPGLTLALLFLLLLMCVQVTPLPQALASRIAQLSTGLKADAVELLGHGSSAYSNESWVCDLSRMTISVSPAATARAGFIFGLCLAAFLVTANCAIHWHDLRRMTRVIIGFGFVLAVTSLVHNMTGAKELLWFHTPRHMEYGFGTFANRNHFASYIIMIMGMASGLLLASSRFEEVDERDDFRWRMSWLSPTRGSRIAVLGFTVVLMTATVFLSLSRGAIVSLVLAVGVAAVVAVRSGKKRKGGIHLVVTILAIAAVLWMGRGDVSARLGTLAVVAENPSGDFRAMASSDSMTLFGMSPLLGSGFGAFQFAFPMVAREELQFGRWVHAHNDWLEWLVEGGVVGFMIVVIAVMLFIREMRKRMLVVRLEKKRFIEGCLIGLIGMGLHSVVDFGLRKPANGLLFAVMAGMVVACLRRHNNIRPKLENDDQQEVTPIPEQVLNRNALAGRLYLYSFRTGAIAALVFVTFLLVWSAESLAGAMASKRFEYMQRVFSHAEMTSQKRMVVSAARIDAVHAAEHAVCNPCELYEILPVYALWVTDNDLDDELHRVVCADMMRISKLAVMLAPSDYLAWMWLARSEVAMGNWKNYDRFIEHSRMLRRGGKLPK